MRSSIVLSHGEDLLIGPRVLFSEAESVYIPGHRSGNGLENAWMVGGSEA